MVHSQTNFCIRPKRGKLAGGSHSHDASLVLASVSHRCKRTETRLLQQQHEQYWFRVCLWLSANTSSLKNRCFCNKKKILTMMSKSSWVLVLDCCTFFFFLLRCSSPDVIRLNLSLRARRCLPFLWYSLAFTPDYRVLCSEFRAFIFTLLSWKCLVCIFLWC